MTDNNAAITAAFAAAAQQPGSTVMFPPGRWVTAGPARR
jgi:polygalacturonase